jgi:hypothetical protein
MTTTPRLALPEPQGAPTPDSMSVNPPAFATIWSNVDGAIGPTFWTSGTKPGTPYACQWIYLTDLNVEQVWDPIASAWVTIKNNPTGIVALSNTQTNVAVTAAGTEYLIVALNNLVVEPFRNYKVHVEGIVGFTFDGTHQVASPTQNGQANIRYANAATVTLAGTLLDATGVDASQSGSGSSTTITAQQNFAFDGIYIGTSSTQLSVCWSYELIGSLSANNSAQYAQNSLIYVERV